MFAAAVIWYGGGLALGLKGTSLVGDALAIRPGTLAAAVTVATGLAVGSLKARYLFLPACRRNLRRIAALARPRLWQCYRPQFFVFLALMIALGGTLSRVAQGTYGLLLGVAVLDFSLATALLAGGMGFWRPDARSTSG